VVAGAPLLTRRRRRGLRRPVLKRRRPTAHPGTRRRRRAVAVRGAEGPAVPPAVPPGGVLRVGLAPPPGRRQPRPRRRAPRAQPPGRGHRGAQRGGAPRGARPRGAVPTRAHPGGLPGTVGDRAEGPRLATRRLLAGRRPGRGRPVAGRGRARRRPGARPGAAPRRGRPGPPARVDHRSAPLRPARRGAARRGTQPVRDLRHGGRRGALGGQPGAGLRHPVPRRAGHPLGEAGAASVAHLDWDRIAAAQLAVYRAAAGAAA